MSYQDGLSLARLNVICKLINKLYARRKYRSDARVCVTANYEINKGASFFSPLPDGEPTMLRLLERSEEEREKERGERERERRKEKRKRRKKKKQETVLSAAVNYVCLWLALSFKASRRDKWKTITRRYRRRDRDGNVR